MADFFELHKPKHKVNYAARRKQVLVLAYMATAVLAVRAIDLHIVKKFFLQQKAQNQYVSKVVAPAYRGRILDRNGEVLAMSTPVKTVAVDTRQLKKEDEDKFSVIADKLNVAEQEISKWLTIAPNRHRYFYLKRRINPDLAEQVQKLKVSGIHFEDELKRFYPHGEVTGHLIGFTNIDDQGQECLERAYQRSLQGVSGKKRVIQDGQGQIIKDIEHIVEPVDGTDLRLTIDNRIQYLAYRELQKAFLKHKAKTASLVVLNAKNGEILAAVNQPAFNPNNRKNIVASRYQNRVMVDTFEPGSTVKPFVVAAALQGKFIRPKDRFKTEGIYRLDGNVIKDARNYGVLSLGGAIKKSSNIALSKIALKMPPEYMWDSYRQLGFGISAGVGFPVEAAGSVMDFHGWNRFEQATLSFGYGMSASLLQLARAYTALADDGILHSVSLLSRQQDFDQQRVYSAETAKAVRTMMERVVSIDGTARKARVEGYRVAGKTGTVRKVNNGEYVENAYLSLFVGMAPASAPRFIIAVMIDEPSAGEYYGGAVAAPVFSAVMAGTLRTYAVSPDQEDSMPLLLTRK